MADLPNLLYDAAACGDAVQCSRLIATASPEAKFHAFATNFRSCTDLTALQIACENGYEDCVKVLLAAKLYPLYDEDDDSNDVIVGPFNNKIVGPLSVALTSAFHTAVRSSSHLSSLSRIL